MKTTMRSMIGLFVCLLLSIPMTAMSAATETFYLTANNLGLTGNLVQVDSSLTTTADTTAIFTFTGLGDVKINEVGLNLVPAVSTLFSWRVTENSDPISFKDPATGSMDGFGKFNYDFVDSENSGSAAAVQKVELELVWKDQVFNSLSDLIQLNNKNKFAGAHIYIPGATGYASTPIPAAAWLLGSGLIGLFGVRRRMQS